MSNILIVDDDDGIRSVLYELLADEGFQVRTACDGAEALKILQCEGDWVVLLDMRMPGMDGRDVLRELEANPRLTAPRQSSVDVGRVGNNPAMPGPQASGGGSRSR